VKAWFAAFLLCAAAPALAANDDPNARDLTLLSKWFEGRWDNDGQVWFEADARSKTPATNRHQRLHAVHVRMPGTTFGAHAFYVEEYTDADPGKVTRQRIVVLESAAPERGLRLRLLTPKDPAAVRGANLAALAKVQPSDVLESPACTVMLRREGGQYVGGLQPKACVFGDGDARRYAVHTLWFGEHDYWREDRSFRVKDDSLFIGHPNSEPQQMRRARNFRCTLTLPARSYTQPDPKDATASADLHDLGDTMTLKSPADGKAWTLQLRRQAYAFYATGSDFLLLRLKREGETASAALATTDASASSISVNAGTALGNCRLVQRAADSER
jgi:hypothetical protein